MSRFLTPGKIGLLVLIAIYTDSEVPSSGIIPVLSFITSRTIPRSVVDSDGYLATSPAPSALDITAFEDALGNIESTVPGRTLHDRFLERLWALNSLHALHGFFRDLQTIIASPTPSSNVQATDRHADAKTNKKQHRIVLARTSPLAIFVRRSALEFTRLQFDDTVRLWNRFLQFRQPSERVWRRRHSNAPMLSFDCNFADFGETVLPQDRLVSAVYPELGVEDGEEAKLSTEEMERLLEFQIEKLQKLGNRLSPEVRESCEKLLQQSSSVPTLTHFVKFFDSWRAGDYTTAFESLHRYFDYTMHTRDRSYYQYALLHMAILQADFGCFSEAVAAINETISTARENQDMNCLNFSLSWLSNLTRTYPREVKAAGHTIATGSEREGLLHLKAKAKEMRLPNLLSSVLLSEAKWLLATGDSVMQAFERVYQSAHLNAIYGFQNMYGVQSLLFVSLYGRLGYNKMSESYCEVLLDCYRHCTPIDEVLRASCRMAYAAVQSGLYKQADDIFESLQPLVHRNLRSQQYLTMYARLMKLKHALRRHDLDAASYLLEQLSCKGPGLAIDPDITFQVQLLQIDYEQRLGNYETAYNTIEDLADSLKADDADIYQRIHVMVLKALLFSKLDKAEKGFTIVMRAASAAWNARILPALWEAWGALANILGVLGEYDAQHKVLEAVIPQALGCGDLALCAQLYDWQASACMGLAGLAEEGSMGRSSWVSNAETYLDRASSYYKRIEDIQGECDTIAKKATIARVRGDEHLAEDWERRYLALYDRHIQEVFDSDEEAGDS